MLTTHNVVGAFSSNNGHGEWKEDGICYSCREQVWVPGTPHRKAGEENDNFARKCRWGFGKCSNCGQEYYAHSINYYKYCPNCGAKMNRGDSDATD